MSQLPTLVWSRVAEGGRNRETETDFRFCSVIGHRTWQISSLQLFTMLEKFSSKRLFDSLIKLTEPSRFLREMFCYPMVVLDQNYGGGPKNEWRMERVLKACQERHAGNFANLRGRGRNEGQRKIARGKCWHEIQRAHKAFNKSRKINCYLRRSRKVYDCSFFQYGPLWRNVTRVGFAAILLKSRVF